ncbi:bifunctional chorismate mutase/prephenate dehydrogenase [Iningainema tapete]|uniref:Bifunctional chorismate mutase/prephenate dehydrogenase n=1 Tax=Iningainema tapete BLCC-T55 TaxID=2748662 RepID=A0A8J6XLL8_9CYAN|nr:bifunctional chorismate mutase/prephenate dehydrogenase [Iningainema tapete]MBD2775061.1 bifunctional chorismate mutase/prephenate dehydrogenase [Iningainema tapete BLCC-T55]
MIPTVTNLTSVTPQKITIIGGSGKMGQFFQAQLEAAGHHVSSLDRSDWEHEDRLEQLLGLADIVLVSVPIERTVDVIERAAKYLGKTTALADITSLKTEPLFAMLKHHNGPVMGLHPMFGPSVKSFSGQKVVVCPGRNDSIFQWLLDLMESQGAQLITCTPEEHDRLMVIIQATRHFARFSLGVFLTEEEVNIDRSLSMASPPYRQEIDIVKRLFAQSSHLCVDIMLATEERCQAIARLADTYNRLAKLVLEKDREALIQEFETTQSLFSDISSHKSDSVTQMSYENHADRHISRHRMSVVSNR